MVTFIVTTTDDDMSDNSQSSLCEAIDLTHDTPGADTGILCERVRRTGHSWRSSRKPFDRSAGPSCAASNSAHEMCSQETVRRPQSSLGAQGSRALLARSGDSP